MSSLITSVQLPSVTNLASHLRSNLTSHTLCYEIWLYPLGIDSTSASTWKTWNFSNRLSFLLMASLQWWFSFCLSSASACFTPSYTWTPNFNLGTSGLLLALKAFTNYLGASPEQWFTKILKGFFPNNFLFLAYFRIGMGSCSAKANKLIHCLLLLGPLSST